MGLRIATPPLAARNDTVWGVCAGGAPGRRALRGERVATPPLAARNDTV